MYEDNNHPSDIDMVYLGHKDGKDVLILGEIKRETAFFSEGQRKLLRKIVDRYDGTAMILYITHNADLLNQDVVDVSQCRVEEYYYKKPNKEGRWVYPKEPLTVRDVIDAYRERKRWQREECSQRR